MWSESPWWSVMSPFLSGSSAPTQCQSGMTEVLIRETGRGPVAPFATERTSLVAEDGGGRGVLAERAAVEAAGQLLGGCVVDGPQRRHHPGRPGMQERLGQAGVVAEHPVAVADLAGVEE